ncbi:MAG: response regulator [Oscillospiraceae bacterium]|nr:response regulator [Oscillospiraceae bacterium]
MNSGRKKIFIVDDDMVCLVAGKNALSSHYDVFPLDSGRVMLEVLQNVQPDLILLDIMMPDMDGHETLKKIKVNEKTANIPVIFLTSKGDTGTVLTGIMEGVNDFIVKPFDPADLFKRVYAQIGS